MESPVERAQRSRPDRESGELIDLVWGRLHARLERDLRPLELLVSALFDRSLEPTEILDAGDRCNRVAVKVGTWGFPEAADLLRRVGSQLDDPDLGLNQAIAMAALVDDARTAVAAGGNQLKLLGHEGAEIAVVGRVCEKVDELIWLAAAQGFSVVHFHDGMSPDSTSDAVLTVLDDPEVDAARPMIQGMRESLPRAPILVVSPVDDPTATGGLAESVTTIVHFDTNSHEILAEVRRAMMRADQRRSAAVVGLGADWLADQLARRGIDAVAEQSIPRVFDRVRSGDARAVVIAPEVDDRQPEELLRVIRADRQMRAAIVVMIHEQLDTARVRATLRAGADDIVDSAIDLDHLAVILKARLARRAVLEPIADTDGSDGAVSKETAVVLIERMLGMAFRQNSPVGLALLRFDTATDDEVSAHELDGRIATEFRRGDVIGRIDDRHLVIALQGVDRNVLLRRLNQLHDKYNLRDRAGRAAGVEFPIDGRSYGELFERARQTLEAAEEAGRAAVTGYEWQLPGVEPAADVLIVDPDRTLGSVLTATLERRGLTVEHQQDAVDALDYLTGRQGRPLPRVVLLELDLRGLDGLQFLRQVRDSGALTRCRVIILSARNNESDLRHAFELGADDYVGKPFSTPLLFHRLSRALGT